MDSAASPKAAATAWITETVARPNTETTAACRPWPARDRTNRIAGPGVRFSARAEIMNKAIAWQRRHRAVLQTCNVLKISICNTGSLSSPLPNPLPLALRCSEILSGGALSSSLSAPGWRGQFLVVLTRRIEFCEYRSARGAGWVRFVAGLDPAPPKIRGTRPAGCLGCPEQVRADKRSRKQTVERLLAGRDQA
jgi:hypothetical protein